MAELGSVMTTQIARCWLGGWNRRLIWQLHSQMIDELHDSPRSTRRLTEVQPTASPARSALQWLVVEISMSTADKAGTQAARFTFANIGPMRE